MNIKFIYFDAGGTMLRTAKPVGQIYADIAQHYGWSADGEFLQKSFLHAWRAMKPRDPVEGARVRDDKLWWKTLVKRTWSVYSQMPDYFPFDDYFEEVYQVFERPEMWRLYPEVEECLCALKNKGLALGVLSNWDRRLRGILQGLEIMDYFCEIVISSEVGVEKPHPHIFDIAQKRTGFISESVLLIGDDKLFDQQGAESVGWKVEIVNRPHQTIDTILAKLHLL